MHLVHELRLNRILRHRERSAEMLSSAFNALAIIFPFNMVVV